MMKSQLKKVNVLTIISIICIFISVPTYASDNTIKKKRGKYLGHYNHFGYYHLNYYNKFSRFNRFGHFGRYDYDGFYGNSIYHSRFNKFDPSFLSNIGFNRLPKPYEKFKIEGKRYYYVDGTFFRRKSGLYYPVVAPIGATVASLPANSLMVSHQEQNYHYANNTLYQQNIEGNTFNVIAFPEGLTLSNALSTDDEPMSLILFSYPNNGQSDEQMEQDRSQCMQWSLKQNELNEAQLNDADMVQHSNYLRALEACLTARNYTVK